MKEVLAIFMGIAITAIIIVALVFGQGTNTIKSEANEYNKNVTDQIAPTPASIYTP